MNTHYQPQRKVRQAFHNYGPVFPSATQATIWISQQPDPFAWNWVAVAPLPERVWGSHLESSMHSPENG